MSYKVSLVAFPSTISDDTILETLGDTVSNLRGDVPFDDAWVRLREIHAVKACLCETTD